MKPAELAEHIDKLKDLHPEHKVAICVLVLSGPDDPKSVVYTWNDPSTDGTSPWPAE